jgi:hypothetical protein
VTCDARPGFSRTSPIRCWLAFLQSAPVGASRARVRADGFCVCINAAHGRAMAMKTSTDRAIEAIEAAELMFANEMGATLNLSPAAKVALVVRIAAAIQAAVADERARLAFAR